MNNKNKVIIGAGASGLIAAAICAKRGGNVIVIEKMQKPGRKLMITGKGRCNITNAVYDLDPLISSVTRNARFLYSAFSAFMPYDTIALMNELGVPTKVERGGRVFPVSDKASDVVDALVKYAKSSGAVIKNGRAASFIIENQHINAVKLDDGSLIECDSVAVCTGGVSYPLTGSTGDGYMLARSAGHTVTKIAPSLIPLTASNGFIPRLDGLCLKNTGVTLFKDGKCIYSDFGELNFTHYGVSGPTVLSSSCHIDFFDNSKYRLVLDLKPALDCNMLDRRILRDFSSEKNSDFINSLSALLPRQIIPVIVSLSGIEPSCKVNQITKDERKKLIDIIKNFAVDISGARPVEEAIVTRGGVNVKEIEPKTMRSKLCDNLYFAGEVIDVDAYTGGFNLQAAFSTGYLCGNNM